MNKIRKDNKNNILIPDKLDTVKQIADNFKISFQYLDTTQNMAQVFMTGRNVDGFQRC